MDFSFLPDLSSIAAVSNAGASALFAPADYGAPN
jgi:hypothetical protein